MKTFTKAVLTAIIWSSLYACQTDEVSPKINPVDEISLEIEKTNAESNFKSRAAALSFTGKSSGWRLNGDGKVQLTREVKFDLELENGEVLAFGLWFIKYEQNKELLVLEDENLNSWERSWDYKSFEDDLTSFYKGFDEARVMINNNVIFHNQTNDSFIIERVEKATVDGLEKSYVTIKFNGTAFGWYDPNGEYQEVYKLTDGTFKGVLE